MGRRAAAADVDRYLSLRDEHWQYKRKVPATLAELEPRGAMIRISLKTRDLAEARRKRDALEAADNELWASLLVGNDGDTARRRYAAAVKRAEAMGLSFQRAEDVAREPLERLAQRIEAIMHNKRDAPAEVAALGLVDVPAVKVSDAFRIYCDEIMRAELAGKSETQKNAWMKVKARAKNNFIKMVSDKPIGEISRADALVIYRYWNDRIAPEQGRATASPSSGNRDLGNMRDLFREYHIYIGDRDRPNPFEGLGFKASKKRKRPPWPDDFIKRRLLQGGALKRMNADARGILLMVVAIGARPSEIANLDPETDIFLKAPVPYIEIQPHEEGENRREIKTQSSRRKVPLVGLGLAVMKAHPNGFPRYRNRESTLSSTLNDFLDANHLLPTPKHTTYGLRHSFEDRMKNGGLDAELRKILMGHKIDRADYGEGGSLEWRARELDKISLPFSPTII